MKPAYRRLTEHFWCWIFDWCFVLDGSIGVLSLGFWRPDIALVIMNWRAKKHGSSCLLCDDLGPPLGTDEHCVQCGLEPQPWDLATGERLAWDDDEH